MSINNASVEAKAKELGWKVIDLINKREDDKAIEIINNKEGVQADLRIKDQRDDTGDTALMRALRPRGHTYSLFEALLKTNRVDVNVQNNYGWTPLMRACMHTNEFNERYILALLKHPDINVNILDKEGKSALSYCNKEIMPNAYNLLLRRILIAQGGMSYRVRRNKSKKHYKRRSKKTKRRLRK
jgi:ankyrin repeat protein